MFSRRPTNSHHPDASHDGAVVRDAQGLAWTLADLTVAADRAAGYLARQVLPAFDPSDPRRGA